MTFNYMVYKVSTCKGYFSVILSAVHRDSSLPTEMHELSRKVTDCHVFRYVIPDMTLRTARDLEVIFFHRKLLYAKLYVSRVNGCRVTRSAYGLFT